MADPNLSTFIWSDADLLRRDYKQSEYRLVAPLQPHHIELHLFAASDSLFQS